MLRALVSRACALHPATVRFTRDARGAPGLDGLPAFISTAGCMMDGEAWSAVALSPSPIGVDLEPGPATEVLNRWTLTEAYLKALGRGLTVAPEQVRVERRTEAETGFDIRTDDAAAGRALSRAHPPLVAAVALLEADTPKAVEGGLRTFLGYGMLN